MRRNYIYEAPRAYRCGICYLFGEIRRSPAKGGTKADKRGFVSMLGLLLTMAIICIMAYFMMKAYFRPPVKDKAEAGFLSEQGVDSTNYKTILDSTKNTLRGITNKRLSEIQETETSK